MPDDASVHPITFKIEAFNPVVRVDDQTFVPSIIEMVTKETLQSVLRQLILAELPNQIVAAVGNGKGCLRLFVSGIFNMMNALPVQKGRDLLNGQLEIMDVACHVISEVLMEQRQLELEMIGAARDLDVAADVSVKDSAGIGIVHKVFQIFLLQEKACGSSMVDIKSG